MKPLKFKRYSHCGGWVKVDESLPDVGESNYSTTVLVSDGKCVGLGRKYRDDEFDFWTNSYYIGTDIDYKNILFWMPMPKAPLDEE